ncbi:SDR family oxidoreductase [Shewanella sp. 125m-1]
MKVVVTGCNGQVGRNLVEQLQQRDDVEQYAMDKAVLDICDPVQSIIGQIEPDVIINAVVYTAVDKAESEPELAFAINQQGPLNLALAAAKAQAVLLHTSTDYVFDGLKSTPYIETDTPNPQTVYGQSKLAGAQAIISHCPRHAILRTAWVFSEYGCNFVKTMLKLGQTRPLNSRLDCQKINQTLGIAPSDWQQGLNLFFNRINLQD